MADPNEIGPAGSRTRLDLAFGAVSMGAGALVLGHVAVTSYVSVMLIGWLLVIGGATITLAGIVRWRDLGSRWGLAAGVLLVVLGLAFTRNPGLGLLGLTLVAGSLLTLGGIVRILASRQPDAPRNVLIVTGAVTVLFGVLVLAQWPVSALWALGAVLGLQLVLDGLTSVLVRRVAP